MASAKPIRFGVGDVGLRHRASTWRCWSQGKSKKDVYVACREIGYAIKGSLHESGRWHFAYTDNFYRKAFDGQQEPGCSRFIERWEAPPELAPGFRLALRILVPWSSVTSDITDEDATKVYWVEPPSPGRAVEFGIAITSSAPDEDSWPGARSMGTRLVDKLGLPDGSMVWVVHWETDMPVFEERTAQANFFKGRSRADLKLGQELRMLAFDSKEDGSRVLYDLVGTYNPRSAEGT